MIKVNYAISRKTGEPLVARVNEKKIEIVGDIEQVKVKYSGNFFKVKEYHFTVVTGGGKLEVYLPLRSDAETQRDLLVKHMGE